MSDEMRGLMNKIRTCVEVKIQIAEDEMERESCIRALSFRFT